MCYITLYLTFLYTYFQNLFCQNKIKKICKFITKVYINDTDIRPKKERGNYTTVLRGRPIRCLGVNLSSHEQIGYHYS